MVIVSKALIKFFMCRIHIQKITNVFLILTAILTIFCFYGCGIYCSNDNNLSEYNNKSSEKGKLYVKEVIDGDTFILSNSERVRLIGINTPEAGRYYFNEAKDVLEILILGKEVELEKDVTDRDKYGRLLRYVYVEELFVNIEMVKRGFANVYTYPPDVKYTEEFLEAERYARLNEAGLWKKSETCKLEVDINYDAEGNDNSNLNGEYVTIKNMGTSSLNLEKWTVKDSGTNIYEFCKYALEPGSAIYLFSGSGKDVDGKLYWGSSKPIWNNDHDTLYLRDKAGLLVEIYNY